ncbi:MAG TPA: CsgG/HfaB family protein, partial [Planctomycetota bacterium]|nr:CsgG/HfaB family protein [Planctomycetota bacterium]
MVSKRSARFAAWLAVASSCCGCGQLLREMTSTDTPPATKATATSDGPQLTVASGFAACKPQRVTISVAPQQQQCRVLRTEDIDTVQDQFEQVLISKEYAVASRSELQSVMKELKFQNSGLTDESQAAEVGKLMNVDAVILVKVADPTIDAVQSYNSFNGQTRVDYTARASISVRMIGVQNSQLLLSGSHRLKERVDGPDGASDVVRHVGIALARSMPAKIAATPVTGAPAALAPSGKSA